MKRPEQSSPEDLEKFKAFVELMGPVPSGRSVGALCRDHPELPDCLREFDVSSAIRLISSLETVPDLHENTIRIEIMLHLAVCCCEGTKQAQADDLRQWASLMDSSPWCRQEDPSEDVFVGYICTANGGFRVYPGIFSNADFILERLLVFLAEKVSFPGFNEVHDSVIELLRVAEAIVNELGQKRYSGSERAAGSPIQIPSDELLPKHSGAVTFTPERLSALGIDRSKLDAFAFRPKKKSNFEGESLFGSPLERFPLYPVEEGFIVGSPSCLCRAAAASILEATPNLGGWADMFFGKESAEFFVNDILPVLDVRPVESINLPASPASLPPLYPYVGQFDLGMPVLALTRCSALTEGGDLESVEDLSDDQIADFTKYIADCCAACEGVPKLSRAWGLFCFIEKSIPFFPAFYHFGAKQAQSSRSRFYRLFDELLKLKNSLLNLPARFVGKFGGEVTGILQITEPS